MNIFDLVSKEGLESLPEDPRQAFSEFSRFAYKRLNEHISKLDLNESYGWAEANEARSGFMNVVLGAARNFGVDPFAKMEMPRVEEVGEKEYKQFKADLDHYMTQIVLETTFQARRDSVEIGADAKSKIRSYLHAIKESVDKADLSDSQKRTLLQKLAEFEKALDGRRLSLAAVALFVLSITTIPGGVAQTIDLVTPLANKILRVVGEEKVAQDSQIKLPFNEQPKPLLPPRSSTQLLAPPNTNKWSGDDLDDDIPF